MDPRIDFPPDTPKHRLRTVVKEQTQPFLDVPVYEEMKARPIPYGVHRAYARTSHLVPRVAQIRLVIKGEFLGWRRKQLRWMKPAFMGGGLMPV